ncbi:MAG: transporter [Pseudomonadales bacterium]
MRAQKLLKISAFFFFNLLLSQSLWADMSHHKPAAHAPIGVMGDHMHKAGEWMFSYRYMSMSMEGNLQGDNAISPEAIALSGVTQSGAPLRVVPVDMTTDMHMFGAMYAPSDKLTLMLMLNYIEKEMDHITFQGMMGANRLGVFTTKTSGIGDTKLSALYSLHGDDNAKIHLNLGLSIPTGKIDHTDQILTPMNTTPSPRLPYPMQLGSGTYDLEPGITYAGTLNSWDWGSQLKMTIRLDDNDEGYSLGDQTQITSWGSYNFANWLTGSLRVTYTNADEISGQDSLIALPVQTSNPDNFGGERIDLGVGMTLIGTEGVQKGHRVALEYVTTIDQDANGIQMEMQDMLTIGYQFSL